MPRAAHRREAWSLRGRNGDGVGATHWVALGHSCQRARSWLGQTIREAPPREMRATRDVAGHGRSIVSGRALSHAGLPAIDRDQLTADEPGSIRGEEYHHRP